MITALLSGPRHRDLQAGWVMVALGLLALLLQNSPVVGPVRIVVVLAFVVAGPGVTVVGPRRDGDLATRLSVSIGASLALATFVAQAMIWIHHWQPTEVVSDTAFGLDVVVLVVCVWADIVAAGLGLVPALFAHSLATIVATALACVPRQLRPIRLALALCSLAQVFAIAVPWRGPNADLRAGVVAVPVALSLLLVRSVLGKLRLDGPDSVRRHWLELEAVVVITGLAIAMTSAVLLARPVANSGAAFLGWIVVAAAFAGAVEELLFRGILFGAIDGRVPALAVGGVVSVVSTTPYLSAGSGQQLALAALLALLLTWGRLLGVRLAVCCAIHAVVGVAVAVGG